MYSYEAFQLKIHSELFFPELQSIEVLTPSQADIIIARGGVSPHGLDSPTYKGYTFQAKPGQLWLNIPKIARFLVTDGQNILIDAEENIDEDSIRVFLLGSCFGGLLMQRGLFLLHGNTIKIGTEAVTFTGLSGAGKSTLTGAFFNRGYSILADDICAVNRQGKVIPGFPQLKLWLDAAQRLTISTQNLRKIRPQIEKYALPISSQFYEEPLPLSHVYILNSHNQENFLFTSLQDAQKFQPLRAQSYRLQFIKGFGQTRQHHIHCAQIANQVKITRITRPKVGYELDTILDYIEAEVTQREYLHANS